MVKPKPSIYTTFDICLAQKGKAKIFWFIDYMVKNDFISNWFL